MSLEEVDFETAIKVIVVGNGGVGKTSLIRRFCKGKFTDTYKKTIGVDFLEKEQFIPALNETVTLMLWDTAGQEEFDAVTRTYYRGAGAAVLAFSTTDRQSFEDIGKWKKKVEAECPDISMVLIQNKIDLIDQAVVEPNEAEALAKRLGLKFYRVCVKDNLNVDDVFEYLSENYIKNGGKSYTGEEQMIGALASSSKPAAGAESSSGPAAAPGAPSNPITTAPPGTPKVENQSFALHKPVKQRTGGKKPMRCQI